MNGQSFFGSLRPTVYITSFANAFGYAAYSLAIANSP